MTLFARLRPALAAGVLLLLFSSIWVSPTASAGTPPSATLLDLYDFGPSDDSAQSALGYSPVGLIAGPNGTFYGLTQSGGANSYGTVFKIQSDGSSCTALHSFESGDGAAEGLTLSAAGLLYGTATNGGANSSGAIFRLAPDGTGWTALYAFSAADTNGLNADGSAPTGSLLEGSGGSLYGETQFGGPYGKGGVYKINPDGSGFTLMHVFGSVTSDGAYPAGGLIAGPDGTLYGTTEFGGAGNSGTVFKLQPDGSGYTVLYQFSSDSSQLTNADGAVPTAALTLGADGLLYGPALVGGSGGNGVIFRIGTDGSGFTVLHAFTGTDSQNVNTDGAFPSAALVKDRAGKLSGTTVSGGSSGLGTLFQLNADGSQFSANYSFQSGDGTNPALVAGHDGLVYGTTADGGANSAGCLFRAGGDSTTHVMWTNSGGQMSLWNYSPTDGSFSYNLYGPYAGWTAAGIADGPDGLTRVLWVNSDGRASFWSLDNATGLFSYNLYGPYAGWTAKALSVGSDNTTHVMWNTTDGRMSLWNYSPTDGSFSYNLYGPYAGWTAAGIADGPDGLTRVLWVNSDGRASFWSLDNATGLFSYNLYGPYAGWTAKALSVGSDNTTHVMWNTTDGRMSLWNYSPTDGSFSYNLYGPYAGWAAAGIADGTDGQTRVLWDYDGGQAALWSLDNATGLFSYNLYGPYAGWTAKAISAGV